MLGEDNGAILDCSAGGGLDQADDARGSDAGRNGRMQERSGW